MARGGHLPSISSLSQWQKVQAEIEDQDIKSAWLGGSDKRKEGDWMWSDGRKWSYTNWAPGEPDNKTGENCVVAENGTWMAASCDHRRVATCDVPKTFSIKRDIQLIFTAENISSKALQFTWKSEAESKNENKIGGLKLTWRIKRANDRLELDDKGKTGTSISGHWKPKRNKYFRSKTWILIGLINFVEEASRKKVAEAYMWRILLKYKEQFKIPIPEEVLFEMAQELQIAVNYDTWLPYDDSVMLGFQMYQALLYCPDHQDEAKRQFAFFESLLKKHISFGIRIHSSLSESKIYTASLKSMHLLIAGGAKNSPGCRACASSGG